MNPPPWRTDLMNCSNPCVHIQVLRSWRKTTTAQDVLGCEASCPKRTCSSAPLQCNNRVRKPSLWRWRPEMRTAPTGLTQWPQNWQSRIRSRQDDEAAVNQFQCTSGECIHAADIDECIEPDTCSQICINLPGTHKQDCGWLPDRSRVLPLRKGSIRHCTHPILFTNDMSANRLIGKNITKLAENLIQPEVTSVTVPHNLKQPNVQKHH
ncbi:low-density lipoprotein receptor-like protein [Lates japonicus]|uniref:Low-density lipoprotein receptor-like protein n=1 Tax=Lates japonicus TaxID=270547 RepID=A0AAD3RFD5_LATJO|nr:low-density lipoprotein receptor-like protein [Lates japonicus]